MRIPCPTADNFAILSHWSSDSFVIWSGDFSGHWKCSSDGLFFALYAPWLMFSANNSASSYWGCLAYRLMGLTQLRRGRRWEVLVNNLNDISGARPCYRLLPFLLDAFNNSSLLQLKLFFFPAGIQKAIMSIEFRIYHYPTCWTLKKHIIICITIMYKYIYCLIN